MKSEELEIHILKRQNREMAIKLQHYRTQNQLLKSKNQELNLWVGNLSQVFATVSASWESITILQQTLLALMKKRADTKDKTLIRKYQLHFKTFVDIINNLSDKIKNPGHSDQATQEAKQQLRSFVKNYQLVFRELLESFFKFNQQYSQLLSELKNKEDIKEQMKTIISKSFDTAQRVKQFETYFEVLKQKMNIFQDFNNEKLLEGIVAKKEDEIHSLKEKNELLQRRIKIMFDYNNASVEFQLQEGENIFQCSCGGAQLNYLKKNWQDRAKNREAQGKQLEQVLGVKSQTVEALQQKLSLVEEQKQNLIKRNSLLVEKISKMNAQYKLTEQMVLRSNVYQILKQQCQSMMDYITQLLTKLRRQQEFIVSIEKSREEQIKQLKKKLEKEKGKPNEQRQNVMPSFNSPTDLVKSEVSTLCRDILSWYREACRKQDLENTNLKEMKLIADEFRRGHDELTKKMNQIQMKEMNKIEVLQFKHEKYNSLELTISGLLQKENPSLIDLWKEFVIHIKTRDKKIRDLESTLRKRDKEISQKSQIEQMMRSSLNETERIYLQNKEALAKTEQFISKISGEFSRLVDENLKTQSQAEQDKNLLNLRLKAQTQARNRLEEKLSMVLKIQGQVTEVRQHESRLQKDYKDWLQKQRKEMQGCIKQNLEKDVIIKNLTDENNEKQKQMQKLQGEKETLKSQVRQFKTVVQNFNASNENEYLKMQLEEYKGKIMCSCTGDRPRQVVLKTCPHLFCKRCIDQTQNNRNRKCPLCGIRFTKTDVHEIKWN